ncbi:PhzF family phenazine biosynthesis protein [Azospirillum sp.]|uniref:PhzF family phenazine biosynthesis protein n=1 Tax=Azospirillum sp. TaxID=34012 RepID=UPI0026227437|nr:PhzF family phenazine biosynthesis protein [Azospirillum sp.]
MRSLSFITADVFTDQVFGGNPLAVFPDGRGLDDVTMQRIARELNLSETVFVLPPETAQETRRLRIFTPAMELPFAGHPTVGTAIILAETGELDGSGPWDIVFGEKVGPIPVRITAAPDAAPDATTANAPMTATLSSARLPTAVDGVRDPAILAALLGLPVSALAQADLPPAAYSAGVPFTIIPLASRAALSAIAFDVGVWRDHLADSLAPHIYAIALADPAQGRHVSARMFAPAMGIAEDPATGAAATALAGYLFDQQRPAADRTVWEISQGDDMGRPSTILLTADRAANGLSAVHVGGRAVIVSRGSFNLPS